MLKHCKIQIVFVPTFYSFFAAHPTFPWDWAKYLLEALRTQNICSGLSTPKHQTIFGQLLVLSVWRVNRAFIRDAESVANSHKIYCHAQHSAWYTLPHRASSAGALHKKTEICQFRLKFCRYLWLLDSTKLANVLKIACKNSAFSGRSKMNPPNF